MTCAEVFEDLKKKCQERGILFVEVNNGFNKVCGEIHTKFYNKFQRMKTLRIELRGNGGVVEKLISTLHELGHEKVNLLLSPCDRMVRHLAPTQEAIIKEEKAAWDCAWELAVQYELDKSNNFRKRFRSIKEDCLATYERRILWS